MRRSQLLQETGRIQTAQFITEVPRDLELMYNSDPEQQNVNHAYKLSGKAKLKGIKEFLDNLLQNSQRQKFIVFAHHHDVLNDLEDYVMKKL